MKKFMSFIVFGLFVFNSVKADEGSSPNEVVLEYGMNLEEEMIIFSLGIAGYNPIAGLQPNQEYTVTLVTTASCACNINIVGATLLSGTCQDTVPNGVGYSRKATWRIRTGTGFAVIFGAEEGCSSSWTGSSASEFFYIR
ncbi:MAG: hypothetical protein AAF149_05130 [Bacteroidota bacterium]